VFRLIVLPRPVFRCLVIVHALLYLGAGNRHDPAQEVREILVFLAVRFVAHGVIIAQSMIRLGSRLPQTTKEAQSW